MESDKEPTGQPARMPAPAGGSASTLAPCGLDCAACAIFQAARDPAAAGELAAKWRQNGFPNAEPGWFRCEGCHGDHALRWSEDCRIALCCEERRLASCSECPEFLCPPLQAWASKGEHHRDALARLYALRGGAGG